MWAAFDARLQRWGHLLVLCFALLACSGSPSEAELAQWRQEALEADKQATLAAAQASGNSDEEDSRELHIVGDLHMSLCYRKIRRAKLQ